MLSKINRRKGAIAALFAVWLGTGIVSRAFADTAFAGEKLTDMLKFNGDMRLRHEDFFNKDTTVPTAAGPNGPVDRHRERFRLRFGVTATMQDFTAGLKFASGTGEQVSTNQTFGNSFSQKGLFIDQAYIQWKALENVKLTGGRMPNPMWRTYASDVMWDADLNPEGYAEQIEMPAGDRLSLFMNLAQLPINELSGSNADPWCFANQIGMGLKVNEDTTFRIGASYYGFINERKSVFLSSGTVTGSAAPDNPVIQEGNTRVAGSAQLASAFQIVHFTSELATHVGPLPLSLQADFLRNLAGGNDLLEAQHANGQVDGYQFGAIIGKAKTKGTWEFAYFRKWTQANASISDWADSDFGNGGTNRKGHIFWLAYAVRDYLTLQGKFFMTSKLNETLNSTPPFGAVTPTALNNGNNPGDINRFQLDVVLKF